MQLVTSFPLRLYLLELAHYEANGWHMDDAGVRASTRKLVELAQREHVALIVHGHDPVQWQTLKKAPDYYS
jgi:hypothetical protein